MVDQREPGSDHDEFDQGFSGADRDRGVPGSGQQEPVQGPPLGCAGPPGGGELLDPCTDAIATLYTFLDGELTPDRRQMIQHHLDECEPCIRKFEFEQELKQVIARKCRDEVPESLRQKVAAALRAEGATP